MTIARLISARSAPSARSPEEKLRASSTRAVIAFSLTGLALCLGATSSRATTIQFVTVDFTDLVDLRSANGEVDGTEFIPQGLVLTTTGIAFNVACGWGSAVLPDPGQCLGADAVTIDAGRGAIIGEFVLPGTSVVTTVDILSIELCCVTSTGSTNTRTVRSFG